MANHWLTHVKKTMKQMKSRGLYKKGDGLKKVIMAAKKTYKKGKRGGGDEPDSEPMVAAGLGTVGEASEVGGRRRRGTRKTRRSRR